MDWMIPRGTVDQLDALTQPTFVDPDELAPRSRRVGPIILALVPDDHAAQAVTFALELAETQERPLMVAHVTPVPPNRELQQLSPAAALLWERHQREASLEALAAFMDEHDLAGVETRVREGKPARALAELAERERAAAIVCGSRRRSTTLGFAGTTVRELVRTARRPVIAVPPVLRKRG